MSRRRSVILARSTAAALLTAFAPLSAADELVTEPIINGVTANEPSVGLFTGGCTATLIGCQTVLTAAHCVCSGSDGSSCTLESPLGSVYFQHSGIYEVSSAVAHPDWRGVHHDLAVLKLSAPVRGVRPVPLNASGKPPNSTPVVLAGFGRTEDSPFGIKRRGRAVLTECKSALDDLALCFDFELPIGTPGEDSGICFGDSGGPLFTNQNGTPVLSGVASGVTGPFAFSCDAPLQGIYSDVHTDLTWIQAQAGGDLAQQSCAGFPNAGSAAAPSAGATIRLGAAATGADLSLEVPENTAALVATLNSEFGANAFELYVRRGTPPTNVEFECKSGSTSLLGQCIVDSPAPGTWYIAARRLVGQGLVQVTATAFGASNASSGACVSGASTACLAQGRFEVEVDWQTTNGSGTAQVMTFGGHRAENNDSAFFWFFSPTNFEMGLKVLDACAVNGNFWVFISGLTDQGWTVRIRDTQTESLKSYSNPNGRITPTTADIAAFSCS